MQTNCAGISVVSLIMHMKVKKIIKYICIAFKTGVFREIWVSTDVLKNPGIWEIIWIGLKCKWGILYQCQILSSKMVLNWLLINLRKVLCLCRVACISNSWTAPSYNTEKELPYAALHYLQVAEMFQSRTSVSAHFSVPFFVSAAQCPMITLITSSHIVMGDLAECLLGKYISAMFPITDLRVY